MSKLGIRLLCVALLVLLLGSVLVQVFVPMYASEVGRLTPEVAYLVIPYSAAAIVFIGCGQVALLVVLRLLSMIGDGVIFTHRSLRWVDVITTCGAVATALAAAVLVHMFAFVPGHGGPTVYFMAACVASGVAFVLLMVVMRGLLEAAVADRAELDGVI